MYGMVNKALEDMVCMQFGGRYEKILSPALGRHRRVHEQRSVPRRNDFLVGERERGK
jgi:hypothetical protein